ncbi:unnamed protein product [Ambrosiozyma monospora]|uniref:Unnamed protein product n=1 Tax=Ambrosiozyma monospora TaxID=43982 RepID=A0A9W7DDV0_AMBMO|nr:unnamed protein product [Ambrosiozyma monospora]
MTSFNNLRSTHDLSETNTNIRDLSLDLDNLDDQDSEDISSVMPSPTSPTVKNVNFKPIKENLIHTMGKGGLTLDNFPLPNPEDEANITADNNTYNMNNLLNSSPLSRPPAIGGQDHLSSPSNRNSVSVLETSSLNGPSASGGEGEQNQAGAAALPAEQRNNNSSRAGPVAAARLKLMSSVKSDNNSNITRLISPSRSRRQSADNYALAITAEGNNKNNTNNNLLATKSCLKERESLSIRRKLKKKSKSEKRNSLDIIQSRPLTQTIEFNSTEGFPEYTDLLQKKGEIYNSRFKMKLPTEKRQDSFHQLFPNIPHTELLIEDFTCAYRKDILIQGKLYLSENNVSFHSGILGLATHFSIPLTKVLSLKKRKTIGIPNAIQFSTLHDKYVFASFIARDVAIELISKIWKMNSPGGGIGSDGGMLSLGVLTDQLQGVEEDDDSQYIGSDDSDDSDYEDGGFSRSPSMIKKEMNGTGAVANGSSGVANNVDVQATGSAPNGSAPAVTNKGDADVDSVISGEEDMVVDDGSSDADGPSSGNAEDDANIFNGISFEGPKEHAPTDNEYDNDANDTKISEDVLNAPLGVVFSLLFGQDTSFMKSIAAAQKNFDISPIPAFSSGSPSSRTYTYIKPLNAPVGPKQTKCIVLETLERKNFDKNVLVIQVTETPDVPAGGSFRVKTKILLSWAPNNLTKIYVATNVVWSAKSWIKGAVEKGSISGQKESVGIMIDELKKKIVAGGSDGPGKKKKGGKSKKSSGGSASVDDSAAIAEAAAEAAVKAAEAAIEKARREQQRELSWSEWIVAQCDFKTLLVTFLIFLLMWDRWHGSGSRPVAGLDPYGEFSGGSFARSEDELWEWIDQRHGVVPRSVSASQNEKRIGHRNGEELDEIITLLEKRLDGLKASA